MADNFSVRDSAGAAFNKAAKDVSSVWFDKVIIADGTNLARVDDFDAAVDERLDSSLSTIAGIMALDAAASAGAKQVPCQVESTAAPNLRVGVFNASTQMPAGAAAGSNIFVTETANAASGGSLYKKVNLVATADAIKASAGTLYSLQIVNNTAAIAYIQVFNVATGGITPGTTVPDLQYLVGAAADKTITFPGPGATFGTAISILAATAADGGTTPGNGVRAYATYK